MKELLLRTFTGILLIVLVAGSILLGALPFMGIICIVYLMGVRELFSLYPLEISGYRWVAALSAGALLPFSFAVLHFQWNPLMLMIPIALWFLFSMISGFESSVLLSLLWLAIPLSCFFSLGWVGGGTSFHPRIPLSVISMLWINDTFAYVTGNLIGKHKMTPRLSPGKTWEGLAGGILITLLAGWMSSRITRAYNLETWLMLALAVSILSLVGDLFESGLKRKKSVKDAGTILPGHGGVLDRFDSLFFAGPGAMIFFIIISLIK